MINQIFFLPHGMQIIPGAEPTRPEIFERLNAEMIRITSEFDDNITHVIVITPHGYSLENQLIIYYHEYFQGQIYEITPDSVVYGTPIEQLQFEGDLNFTDKLVEAISELKPEKLVHGSSGYPMTLNWGTTVPLYYFRDRNIKVSILGVPRIRHTDLKQLNRDMKLLAKKLLNFTEEQSENIALIVSGDLSHVHRTDGPYGYHESCEEFDHLVQKWFKDSRSEYMRKIIDLQPTALACGMAGMMLLQEIFETKDYVPTMSFYDVPTYFGMGIGHWNL